MKTLVAMPPLKKSDIQGKLAQMTREAEERDAKRRAEKSACAYMDARTTPINVDALGMVAEEDAKKARLAVIEYKKEKIALAVHDPREAGAQKIIEELKKKGYEVVCYVVSESNLAHIQSFYKFVQKTQETITGKFTIDENTLKEKVKSLEGLGNALVEAIQQPRVTTGHILDLLVVGALINRASDIHLESREAHGMVRLRIDGALHDVPKNIEKGTYASIVSRIKLLAELKLNIKSEPQDGRFSIAFDKKQVEVRVAVAPSEFGESVVMRLLDPDAINISLEELGLRPDDREILERELAAPNGLLINTGPTGSGKTTTLYACLRYKQSKEIKIITIEDPIEYHIEGIEQTQVDEEAGYTFASGLRSLMRQDPDVILVGEMRDKETAEIGVQAALTGHLVLSTVHANEAAGAVPRLIDLGVRAGSIGPALNCIIAQRLVRRLCGACKVKKEITGEFKSHVEVFIKKLPTRVEKKAHESITMYDPKGCAECNGIGYKGRIAIYELLRTDEDMKELIEKEVSQGAIKERAHAQGMVTMQQDGILKTLQGVTTLEEVAGATGEIVW